MGYDPTQYEPRDGEPPHNPYELTSPYDYLPEIPPPPPTKRNGRMIVLWVAMGVIALSLIALLFFGVAHYTANDRGFSTPTFGAIDTPTATTTETPTMAPTPTPTPTVTYIAADIYNDFYANGLGGSDPKDDHNWSCCTYTPEGGAIIWTDSTSGWKLDLAVFSTKDEAETDASQLFAQGFYSNVVHNCLLSYEKQVPTSVLSGYVGLMQTYCN